jgi:hypothetical protein
VLGLSAEAPPQQLVQKPTIEIAECVVYREGMRTQSVDCTEKVRAACNGLVRCELPIGLGLTDGRQVDGDARTWKKVRVRYRCGKIEHVNGPHNQNDHATMLLGCGRGF